MSSSADLYCVMGNPVAHSRSPAIHARFAELTGEHLVYERCLLPIDGFAQGVRDFIARGGRGCNVTVPFKIEAAALATHRSERVQLAGAANTLVFAPDGIHADNTDGLGLVADITRNAGLPLAGRDVLLVGAGGALPACWVPCCRRACATSPWPTVRWPGPRRWCRPMPALHRYKKQSYLRLRHKR